MSKYWDVADIDFLITGLTNDLETITPDELDFIIEALEYYKEKNFGREVYEEDKV